MHDYWNDPPESPEAPECCDQEMIMHKNGDCECEIDPPDAPYLETVFAQYEKE